MFLIFTNPHTKKRVIVNSDHVRTAAEVEGSNWVTLTMDAWESGGLYQDVVGDLDSVWYKLRGESHAGVDTPMAFRRDLGAARRAS